MENQVENDQGSWNFSIYKSAAYGLCVWIFEENRPTPISKSAPVSHRISSLRKSNTTGFDVMITHAKRILKFLAIATNKCHRYRFFLSRGKTTILSILYRVIEKLVEIWETSKKAIFV